MTLRLCSLSLFDGKLATALSLCTSKSDLLLFFAMKIISSLLSKHGLMSPLGLNSALLCVFSSLFSGGHCSSVLSSSLRMPGANTCSMVITTSSLNCRTMSLSLLLAGICCRCCSTHSSCFSKFLLVGPSGDSLTLKDCLSSFGEQSTLLALCLAALCLDFAQISLTPGEHLLFTLLGSLLS